MKSLQVEQYGVSELSHAENSAITGGLFNSVSGVISTWIAGTYLGKNLSSFFDSVKKGISTGYNRMAQ